MTSKAHKGNRGGDPSRRPVKIEMSVPCQNCKAPVSFLGNGKSVPTLFCSEKCRYDHRKAVVLQELRGYGVNLTASKNRSSTSLNSILSTCEMIAAVSKGKKIYSSPKLTCATCGEKFTYLSLTPINNVRLYCSGVCHKNRNSRVPSKSEGVLCPRPEKLKFSSLSEADAHLATMMDDDIARNADLTSYVCVCGAVHFGSIEKSIFEKEERNILESKKQELNTLLNRNPKLKVIS